MPLQGVKNLLGIGGKVDKKLTYFANSFDGSHQWHLAKIVYFIRLLGQLDNLS